ncbi:MAG: ThiF family adenylyltransferase [Bacilli bacterium]|nr:ThiF family adenylyltransferase [Bacilli bacterium]
MFERTISLVGEENFEKIKEKTVLIVGLGGVGGYATEALVRTGVHNLILIDHDTIDITNLNRQIISTSKNIGNDKVEEFKKRIFEINPSCNVIIHKLFLDRTNSNILDNYQIDYIIDCCDSVDTKKLLIDYSIDKNVKLISSMGTANKMDPTKLEIIDIRKTSYDPLAKILRKYVNDLKTNKKIMVVSSTEEPLQKEGLTTLVFVPATAGILCANYVINNIINS